MTNAYRLRKTLAQVATVIALFAPADASALASPVASYAETSPAASVRYADSAASTAENAGDVLPQLTMALIDEADAEVARAHRVLNSSELYAERSFDEYLSELSTLMESWRALTPRARTESERIQQLLAFPEVTAQALQSLATSLALAHERLADSVETLPAWNAVRRAAGDADEYVEVPSRFIEDTAILFAHESPLDVDRIQTWLDLNEA